MPTIRSFGTVTITDLTDVGVLSVCPTGNLPDTIIYNPDQNTYTPNWGNNNLVLTPIIYYGGTQLNPASTTGLTITWTRQEGIATPTALTTGETVTNGILTVSANKFNINSTNLSYICTISYTEPNTSSNLTAAGRLTFSLVKQASSVKTCVVTGDNIFKYNSSQSIVGPSSITLTGTVNNCSISQWQYLNSSNVWAQYPNSGTETTLTVNATDSTFVGDKVMIKLTTNESSVYDIHTITKLKDGQTGEQGAQGNPGANGEDATNVVLGNYADVIPCTSDNKTIAQTTITIPFAGYKGTSKVSCNVATPSTLFGVTATVTQATASVDGSIVYVIPTNTSVNSATGTLSFIFTCNNKTITMEYRWTRSTAATNGVNAVILQLSTPQGNIINNGTGSVSIVGTLIDGAIDKTNSTTWAWAKYNGSTYDTISGQTTNTLIVNPSAVDGLASFRCTATYNSKSYIQYMSIMDKSDPLQIEVMCSLGEQIVNGQGIGALYVIAMKNGVEVDPIKTLVFSTVAPTSASSGDYYYHLNSSNNSVTLKKYNGSSWQNAPSSELPTGTYEWTYWDNSGNIITPTGLATTGKVVYIDSSLINKKLTAMVRVVI